MTTGEFIIDCTLNFYDPNYHFGREKFNQIEGTERELQFNLRSIDGKNEIVVNYFHVAVGNYLTLIQFKGLYNRVLERLRKTYPGSKNDVDINDKSVILIPYSEINIKCVREAYIYNNHWQKRLIEIKFISTSGYICDLKDIM